MKQEVYLGFVVFFPFLAGILVYIAGVCSKNGGAGKKEGHWAVGAKDRAAQQETREIQREARLAQYESRGAGKPSQKNFRDALAIGAAVAEWLLMAALALPVLTGAGSAGEAVPSVLAGAGSIGEAMLLELPEICGMGLRFTFDGFRAVYGCVAAFMWMMAAILSREYFAHHHNRSRFYLFLFWTLGATMGVFLSADLYTTFLFFEVMSFTSYVWVAQEESETALRAAETYLAVAVAGGLVLLMGLFLLYHQLGTLEIRELAETAAGCGDRRMLYAAGLCMLVGFGAKAGAFPLHIWLPKAHPVAPAPASALLSGVLTKTGIYGILILSCQLFFGDKSWGKLMLLIGVITMLGGAVLAVFSVDLKRTLACSSMSQIGFILVGIGMLVLPGEGNLAEGAAAVHTMLAARGVLLHMVNHSLIKLVLFLSAGVIFMNAHALNLNDIRGFGRKKPLLLGVFLTGACAISGIPFFGGYISKTLLHESITVYGGDAAMKAVEALFLFSGGLTFGYMAKLFVAIFVEKNADAGLQEKYDSMKSYMDPGSVFALGVSALVLLFWGFFPHAAMEQAAEKMQGFLGMAQAGEAVSYFSLENIRGGMVSIAIGAAVYLLFVRKCLLRRKEHSLREYVDAWPEWLDLEELVYRPLLLKVLPTAAGVLCRILDSCVDLAVVALRKTLYRDSKLPYERPEGNAVTEALGKMLNAAQGLGNCTWRRRNPRYRDYVHLMAVKSEEISETNHIIRRSLSFGLLLVCIGLSLTLFYIIWW